MRRRFQDQIRTNVVPSGGSVKAGGRCSDRPHGGGGGRGAAGGGREEGDQEPLRAPLGGQHLVKSLKKDHNTCLHDQGQTSLASQLLRLVRVYRFCFHSLQYPKNAIKCRFSYMSFSLRKINSTKRELDYYWYLVLEQWLVSYVSEVLGFQHYP